MQNLGHKRFCFANLEDASKGAEKKSREFCSVLQAWERLRLPLKTLNTAPAT